MDGSRDCHQVEVSNLSGDQEYIQEQSCMAKEMSVLDTIVSQEKIGSYVVPISP